MIHVMCKNYIIHPFDSNTKSIIKIIDGDLRPLRKVEIHWRKNYPPNKKYPANQLSIIKCLSDTEFCRSISQF